jgi:hypothetical protein
MRKISGCVLAIEVIADWQSKRLRIGNQSDCVLAIKVIADRQSK